VIYVKERWGIGISFQRSTFKRCKHNARAEQGDGSGLGDPGGTQPTGIAGLVLPHLAQGSPGLISFHFVTE